MGWEMIVSKSFCCGTSGFVFVWMLFKSMGSKQKRKKKKNPATTTKQIKKHRKNPNPNKKHQQQKPHTHTHTYKKHKTKANKTKKTPNQNPKHLLECVAVWEGSLLVFSSSEYFWCLAEVNLVMVKLIIWIRELWKFIKQLQVFSDSKRKKHTTESYILSLLWLNYHRTCV